MTKSPNLGGKREGSGRKKLDNVVYSARLPRPLVESLRQIEKGEIRKTLQKLVEDKQS